MKEQKEILIIDDEVDFRLSVAEILVENGYKVITARNGQDALRLIQENKKLPDLITVDMNMPVKDGLEFQQEVAELIPDVPLIMISGFIPKQLNKLKGIRAFLNKPLDKFELLNTIRNHFTFSS